VAKAVDGVDLALGRQQTLGLVGESGCGKSITAMSIMRLLKSPPGKIAVKLKKFRMHPVRVEAVLAGLTRIYDAVDDRRADVAAEAVECHLRDSAQRMVDAYLRAQVAQG